MSDFPRSPRIKVWWIIHDLHQTPFPGPLSQLRPSLFQCSTMIETRDSKGSSFKCCRHAPNPLVPNLREGLPRPYWGPHRPNTDISPLFLKPLLSWSYSILSGEQHDWQLKRCFVLHIVIFSSRDTVNRPRLGTGKYYSGIKHIFYTLTIRWSIYKGHHCGLASTKRPPLIRLPCPLSFKCGCHPSLIPLLSLNANLCTC